MEYKNLKTLAAWIKLVTVWNLPRDTEWQIEITVSLRMLWMLFHQNTWSGQRDFGGKADNNRMLNDYITARLSLSGECLLPRKC